jgi:hypothetical protein
MTDYSIVFRKMPGSPGKKKPRKQEGANRG